MKPELVSDSVALVWLTLAGLISGRPLCAHLQSEAEARKQKEEQMALERLLKQSEAEERARKAARLRESEDEQLRAALAESEREGKRKHATRQAQDEELLRKVLEQSKAEE